MRRREFMEELFTGDKGYSREDRQRYLERYRRSSYPDTYRPVSSNYASMHVGTDSGRQDTYALPDRFNRGKGPRNYQRSDIRILEDINDRLCDNIYLDASEVEVAVQNGEVVLTGAVDNREDKYLVEEIAEYVTGVHQVENRLRVKVNGV